MPSLKCTCRALSTLCVVFTIIAFAQQRAAARPLISQMVHTSWRAREGAPQGISALVQSPDGILWIGSSSGLYTFDGFHFAAFHSPVGEPGVPIGPVVDILVARDGCLWIAFAAAPIVRICKGNVRAYAPINGMKLSHIVGIQQTPDGKLWAVTNHDIWSLGEDRLWHLAAHRNDFIRHYLIDSTGAMWLAANKGLYRRGFGDTEFVQVSDESSIVLSMTRMPDGGVLVSDFMTAAGKGRTRRFDRHGQVVAQLAGHDVVGSLLPMQDNSVWLGTEAEGIKAVGWLPATTSPGVAQDPHEDRYDPSGGATSNSVHALLQDLDGNIWAGTNRGLDQFRLPATFTFSEQHLPWRVCSGANGKVWLGNGNGDLYTVTDSATTKTPTGNEDILSIACAKDGDVWFVARAGLFQMVNGQPSAVQLYPKSAPYQTTQVTSMSDGSVLVRDWTDGQWILKNGHWSQFTTGLESGAFLADFIDSQHRIWTSVDSKGEYFQTISAGQNKTITVAHADLGPVAVFAETSFGVIAGGLGGISIYQSGAFRSLKFQDPMLAHEVTGLVQARNGDIWLIGSRGIAHVEAQQMQHALRNGAFAMAATLIAGDDAVGQSMRADNDNVAAIDGQGHLWFSTLNGLVWLDPANQPPRPRSPLVSIRSISADGRAPDEHGRLKPDPSTLELDYLGVNLSTPDDVIYKYMLVGADSTWQEVGGRRVAIYTHLHPGKYIFEVSASNGDGVWTPPTISDPFFVMPSFYQTWWFVAVCISGGVVLSAFSLRLYLQIAAANIRARADARADERIRIAQDIHDTLLQGVQGLLLNFHVAAQALSTDDKSRLMLERALSTADKIIVEGRSRVTRLRSEHVVDAELVELLNELGFDLNFRGEVKYTVERGGRLSDPQKGCRLESEIVGEIYYVAREAVTNAFRHSDATEIFVSLDYGASAFVLTCTDNGNGFAQEHSEGAPGRGHWGILGMVERSERFGGTCKITSWPGAGTEVKVKVPAIRAYRTFSWFRAVMTTSSRREIKGESHAALRT